MVDELNRLLYQRKREITALNALFQTHLRQDEAAREAYDNLKSSLASFDTEFDGLATIAGMTEPDVQDILNERAHD